MAQKQRFVNILSKTAPLMDGHRGQEKEKLRTSRWRKQKKDEHLKLLIMSRTIFFYKNNKK